MKRLLNLLRRARPLPSDRAPSVPADTRVYAIGDVHGRLDLLRMLIGAIEAEQPRLAPVAESYIVFLGDLIDRGEDSAAILDFLMDRDFGMLRPVFLMGNHEEGLLRVLGGNMAVLDGWLRYGGDATLRSYGIADALILQGDEDALVAAMHAAIPVRHRNFMASFGDTFEIGDYLFVHAGLRPGIPLEQQMTADLRWIRGEFLDSEADHGWIVVHGHTIVEMPQERPNRIAIDTGAYYSGRLTALALDGDRRRFLTT